MAADIQSYTFFGNNHLLTETAYFYRPDSPYSIETEGKTDNRFDTENEVCLYIRANHISEFKVYKKDDSQVKSQKVGAGIIFPLVPMCEDITSKIKSIIEFYDKPETDLN